MNAIVKIEDLKSPAKRIAAQAIENVHLAYFEKGGIRDTATQLQGQLESAARHVYSLAQFAAKAYPDDNDRARHMYLAMCEYAEQTYKAEHEVENLREALPTWATYKSNVLRGLRIGLDPREFKTEKVFRSKTMELVSRTRTDDSSQAHEQLPNGEARAGPPALRTQEEIEEFVTTTTVPESLKLLLAQVVYAAEVVRPARVSQAEEILREAWQKLGSLTDKRRLRG